MREWCTLILAAALALAPAAAQDFPSKTIRLIVPFPPSGAVDILGVAESGFPGFDAGNWFGAVVRTGTPKAAIDRMSAEIARALQLPEVRDALVKLGLSPGAMSPSEFDAFLRAEMENNGKIIRALNLKIE